MLSKTRKENRNFRMRTAVLKHAVADVQGIIFPPQAGQGKVKLNFSKGDLDQKIKFPNSRRCETLGETAWVFIESLLLKVSKSRLEKLLSKNWFTSN